MKLIFVAGKKINNVYYVISVGILLLRVVCKKLCTGKNKLAKKPATFLMVHN